MADAGDLIRERIEHSLEVKRALLAEEHVDTVREMAAVVVRAFRDGRKLLLCGNGGSASDAMHIAAEFVGRFRLERPGLPAISLADSQAVLTCIGNDYAFDRVFERAVDAHGVEGDVLWGLSTSGTSPNVVAAMRFARERGLRRIAMTGEGGGDLAALSDVCLRVPSRDTARIQEGYMLMAHTVCELVEAELFST